MRTFTLAIIFSLLALTNAQFQFFEQMFNGGQQQQQQQPQNVASDSAWYQQTYESGRLPFPSLSTSPIDFPYVLLFV